MNKILFAALAALVITGCSQNENDAPGNNAEIRFNTIVNKATIGSASRATPMVTANFKNFTVYGYNPEVKFDGADSLGDPFMDGVSATKSGETWSLVGGPYYWPAKGIPAFFAYSPATNVKDYAVGDPAGYPSFSYTIQDTQEDLLVAQKLDAANAAAPISLAFSHILTQINFSAELEAGFDYVVTKIEIAGVNNVGTFTYAANPGWTATTGVATYEYAGNYSATPIGNVVNFSNSTNALLLLPQTVPANATISVTYKATATGGNQQVTFDGTKSVDLNAAVWAVGKNIRYKLKLASGGQEISFEPSVTPWVDEESAQEPK